MSARVSGSEVSHAGVKGEDGTFFAGDASDELVKATKDGSYVRAVCLDGETWTVAGDNVYGAPRVTVEGSKPKSAGGTA